MYCGTFYIETYNQKHQHTQHLQISLHTRMVGFFEGQYESDTKKLGTQIYQGQIDHDKSQWDIILS